MRALAIYDFDGTMISGDSIVALLRFARRRRCLSRFALLRAGAAALRCRIGALSAGEAKRRALGFLDRMPDERRIQLEADFADALVAGVYPAALRQMARDRENGRLIVILSASTDNYMIPLARQLGADQLICTRLQALPDGNCRGEEKVRRLNAWLAREGIVPDWPGSSAYADSLSDVPVLSLVGHPCLVNPSAKTTRQLGARFPISRWRA